jgi:hypothetical protein
MGSLLDRIRGVEFEPHPDLESIPDIPGEIPDRVPDEWSELTPDPVPGARKSSGPAFVPKTHGNVTPALKKRISAELEAYIEFAAMPVIMRDPTCGGALHDQAKPIADSITAILAKYPDLAHKFLATGMLGDWLKLGIAFQPVIKAIWDHHVVKTPEGGQGDGLDLDDFEPYRPGL